MKNILYVEDDDISAIILTKMLGGHYDIQVVPDGEHCLEIIRKRSFDLILMDINLGSGNMDGIATLKKIKMQEDYRHIPVFAVTSYATPEDKKQFLKEGFDGYFSKPIKKADLLEAISQALKN